MSEFRPLCEVSDEIYTHCDNIKSDKDFEEFSTDLSNSTTFDFILTGQITTCKGKCDENHVEQSALRISLYNLFTLVAPEVSLIMISLP